MKLFPRILLLLFVSVSLASASIVDDPNLESRIESMVGDRLNSVWQGSEVSWEKGSPWRIKGIPAGADLDLEVNGRPRGATVLNLVVSVDDKRVSRIPLSVRITVNCLVPVVDVSLDRHTLIQGDLLRWERRDVTHLSAEWPSSPAELAGKEYWSERALRRGAILTWDALEPKPAVLRDEEVMLVATRGGITVTTTGIALQQGKVGQRIKVRNLTSGVLLTGRVQASGRVLVEGVLNDRKR